MLVILTRNESLSSLTTEDASFIERYDDQLKRMADLKSHATSTQSTEYVAQLEKIVDSIQSLEAPSHEWADLKSETVQELRRRLDMMRLRHAPSPDELNDAEERWFAIQRRFRRIMRAKRRFRKYWPMQDASDS